MQRYRGHRIEAATVEEAGPERSYYSLHSEGSRLFERMYELLTGALVPQRRSRAVESKVPIPTSIAPVNLERPQHPVSPTGRIPN